jgi:hypothetical protein
MRPADLGVCAPSGTRTPNPLKTGPHIVAVVALPLMLATTCTFALSGQVAPWHCYAPSGPDGGGVKGGRRARSLEARLACQKEWLPPAPGDSGRQGGVSTLVGGTRGARDAASIAVA